MNRFAVMLPADQGAKPEWSGSKTYSYRDGTHNRRTDFDHARVFTRRTDALAMAIREAGVVVPLKLVPIED